MPPTSQLNEPLLRKAYEYIREHPQDWSQKDWWIQLEGCGTVMCLAGTACYLAGDSPRMVPMDEGDRAVVLNDLGVNAVSSTGDVQTRDGQDWAIEDRARELLGIDAEQAATMFYSTVETLPELRKLIHRVTGFDPEVD